MAVTPFQAAILRLLAQTRKQTGESYVAGGVALNLLLAARRRSHDIDLFHDTAEALAATWDADRTALQTGGYDVRAIRQAPTFVEAVVSRGDGQTALQWVRDSAFRFFPLVEDELMGLALHPFDLATNKTLATVGRGEVRAWIDLLHCDVSLQPLGYLVWAACGKDPGYNPRSILALSGRHHYSQAEVEALDFEGVPPDAGALGRHWHEALTTASGICDCLPAERVGTCVLDDGGLFRGGPEHLADAVRKGRLSFHEGRIGGSWPTMALSGQ